MIQFGLPNRLSLNYDKNGGNSNGNIGPCFSVPGLSTLFEDSPHDFSGAKLSLWTNMNEQNLKELFAEWISYLQK